MKIIKSMWKQILVIVVLLLVVGVILVISPNFKKDPNEGKINLIINNNNVTGKLKKPIIIDTNGVVYLSKSDIDNYFDG